jgi:hypothetical protein
LLKGGESFTREELTSRLCKEPNRNAFDNVRKQLIKRVYESIVSEMASQEDDPLGYTLGLMMLCHRMARRRAPAVVLHFADKTEEPATGRLLYLVLEAIYAFQMQHACRLGINIVKVANKKQTNPSGYSCMRPFRSLVIYALSIAAKLEY